MDKLFGAHLFDKASPYAPDDRTEIFFKGPEERFENMLRVQNLLVCLLSGEQNEMH